jgi:hypothetical protein
LQSSQRVFGIFGKTLEIAGDVVADRYAGRSVVSRSRDVAGDLLDFLDG